jgi:O-methyltransferase
VVFGKIIFNMKNFLGKLLFKISRSVLKNFGFSINLGSTNSGFPELNSDELEFIRSVHSASLTMTSFESAVTLALACKYIEESGTLGDFVEAGVWRGGSSIIARRFLDRHRNFYLYDTFKGMTEPTVHDFRLGETNSNSTFQRWQNMQNSHFNSWVFSSLDEVKANFERFKLLDDKIEFIEGNVLQTLTQPKLPQSIALLRLDTDFYDSTLIELQVLWPRLSTGGVLILDDYGHWDGARKAVDEYFATSIKSFKIPISGGGGRLVIKC